MDNQNERDVQKLLKASTWKYMSRKNARCESIII